MTLVTLRLDAVFNDVAAARKILFLEFGSAVLLHLPLLFSRPILFLRQNCPKDFPQDEHLGDTE
ncbi:MAG: hypothetical protein HC929_01500 [Leptolyngbyaceae cyanobacterium SM2_5_2]|nr:hypothetical protein [Leptolyngbyaceae cyanobacterium SM2_5_2]